MKTDATPKQIQEALSLCGPSVERLHQKGEENIYDVEVTSNRVDLMSVVGIAQEALAILPTFGHKSKLLKNPLQNSVTLKTTKKVDYLTVEVDPKLCLRFSAVLIKEVDVATSPKWLTDRLDLVGMRGLNNVVDISNYLMHALGQPVHTFDYDKIKNAKMKLRESRKGEIIITLDHKKHTLPGGDIVVEDGSGELIDLCGIMGGLNSAVDVQTKNVLLFMQTYEPTRIRKTSMALAHRTSAAVLFEKGLPVENVLPTLEEGIALFEKITKGKAVDMVLDIVNTKPQDNRIKLSEPLSKLVSRKLGTTIDYKTSKKILTDLGFDVMSEKDIGVPAQRAQDVTIAEDLVEEVARIYGYHNLPSELMAGALPTLRPMDQNFTWERKIKDWLSSWGFTESYTYSLVAKDTGLKLKNPLSSEWTYLRTALAPSHKQLIADNLGRAPEITMFEIANVYKPQGNGLPHEELHLIISSSRTDYYWMKGIVEALEAKLGTSIGYAGITVDANCIYVEVNLEDVLPKATAIRKYKPISKFPPVVEDINIMHTGNYDEIEKKIFAISPLITNVQLIDKYDTKLTLRITYHTDSKQLSTEDVVSIRTQLMELGRA